MPTTTALEIAKSAGLDLVEVGANADPPACKIMDYGRHKYEQTRKQKEKQRGAKQTVVKTVKLRPKIGENDLETKINQAAGFILKGNKVKVQVQFRGREITHQQIARDLLDRFSTSLSGSAVIEAKPSLDGRMMTMLLAPR